MPKNPDLPTNWVMVRFSAMGDVTLTTGVLEYWRRKRGWKFSVLTRKAFAPLFQGHPAVDTVLGLDEKELHFPGILSCFRRLADQYPDAGLLDLHGTLRTRILGSFWRGPKRVYPKMSLERRLFLVSRNPNLSQRLLSHNVPQRYALAIEKKAPPREELLPCICVLPEEMNRALNTLKFEIPGFDRLQAPVAIHPYATHHHKAWKPENWLRLTQLLQAEGIPWFVIGRGDKIPGMDPKNDLTNTTSLRETCALLGCASVLVTGDSGPMHLAAGVDTPVIALFGPTAAEWGFMPAGAHDHVLEVNLPCRPCTLHGQKRCPNDHACMTGITPERVMEAIRTCIG